VDEADGPDQPGAVSTRAARVGIANAGARLLGGFLRAGFDSGS
jgi:hypothetical protein